MTGMGSLLSSYTAQRSSYAPKNVRQVLSGFAKSDENEKPKADVSKMRRALRKGTENLAKETNVSVIDNMKMYSQALKKQRETTNETALAKKKLKYSFKKISTKIVSSKTSFAAREAVSQARREVQKLKAAKRTGKYDPEEIEAALDHAKSMERIARRKERHLEEEEMAKRCCKAGDGNSSPAIDTEGADDKKDPVQKEIDGIRKELRDVEDKAGKEEYIESEEATNEMISEITSGMEEMLDAIEELNDLMNELAQNLTDLDPEDIKTMVIKHRNKEMKEITKADAEYLKAMFDHYDKIKADGGIPFGTASGGTYPGETISAPAAVVDVAL